MKHDIKIKYDGEYPCLCMGHLEVWVDSKYYDFGEHCLSSGGSCTFSDDWTESIVEQGDWSINRFPSNFPMELEDELLEVINKEITHGCLWWLSIIFKIWQN